jgi:cytochrome c oxidase assembly protein Cox11
MTRFLYLFFTDTDIANNPDTPRAATVTLVYFFLWVWIYIRMRVEIAHKKVNDG